MSARRAGWGFLWGIIVGVVILVGAVRVFRSPRTSGEPTAGAFPSASGVVTPSPEPEESARSLIVLARDDDSDGAWDAVITLRNGIVEVVPTPADTDRRMLPITDGEALYVVVTRSASLPGRQAGKRGRPERQLIAVDFQSRTETLVTGSTPLVVPQRVTASPNGRVIFFFLDDRTAPRTEAWTYDPLRREKRLSLERLSKSVRGPFWAPDGGFLVHDGVKIIRGSPRRTGGDLLPITRSWEDLLPGSTIIPSPDGSQVVYAVAPRGREAAASEESEIHVWDLGPRRERTVARLPSTDVQFLGWSVSGALLVAVTDGDGTTVWELRRNQRQPHALGSAFSSVVLSGDGETLAAVRSGSEGTYLSTFDARVFSPLGTTLLPSPAVPEGGEAKIPTYTLVQFLQEGVGRQTAESRGDTLAPEDVVRYVVEHIREITDAPAGEPATAERVWFLSTPNAVMVDYRIGTTLWRRLIQLQSLGGKITGQSVLGVFAPAEGAWVLVRGQTLPDAHPTVLYEYEPEVEKWVRKETSQDIQP